MSSAATLALATTPYWTIPLRGDQPTPVPDRPAAMFEVRESDHNDQVLFAAMIEQTYSPFLTNPWVAPVVEAGMALMRGADEHTFIVHSPDQGDLSIKVLISRVRRGRTVVVTFQLGPFVHVWSMSSAASTNHGGDNDFTAILIDRIREIRPQVLVAANISRLVRSDQEGGLLLKVLPDHVDEVWAGQLVMKLVGEGSEYGRMMFSVLGSVAAMERNWIVTRLMTGRVAAWRRGEWIYGKQAVPFGYRLDEDRRLVPIPEMRDKVRQMLLILGNDEAPSLIVRRLVDMGMTMKRGDRLMADSYRAHNNARAVVDSLLAWVPLWVAGEHVWRFSSPMRDAHGYAGVPVVDSGEPGTRAELQLLLRPGVPNGGWAEPTILDRAMSAARSRFAECVRTRQRERELPLGAHVREISSDPDLHESVLGPTNEGRRPAKNNPRRRGTRKVAPFSGYAWRCADEHFELKSAPAGRYQIVRRDGAGASA